MDKIKISVLAALVALAFIACTDNDTKFDPDISWPDVLYAAEGWTLEEVAVTGISDAAGTFAWAEPSLSAGESGTRIFTAVFTPLNTRLFNTMNKNIPVTVISSVSIEGDWPDSLADSFDTTIGTQDIIIITGIQAEVTDTLSLDIPMEKTVVWAASVSADNADPLIALTGEGTLVIQSGRLYAATGTTIRNNAAALIVPGGIIESASGYAVNNTGSGKVSVAGGIVSSPTGRAINNAAAGSIHISGGTIKGGEITNSDTVHNAGTGTVEINGGKVSSIGGRAIHNSAGGTINVSGGTVGAGGSGSTGIRNNAGGIVNISGGTISTMTGWTMSNGSSGSINITGGVIRSSDRALHNSAGGTIHISGGTIRGGEITNADAVQNAGGGLIEISGGRVIATVGRAINNNSGGTVNVAGGIVSAGGSGSTAIRNSGSGTLNISGGTTSTTEGWTVSNAGEGTINISGGTIRTENNRSLTNASTGLINISQADTEVPTFITSANTLPGGTIVINDTHSSPSPRLIISGGTIQNTAANANAIAILSSSAGSIHISGADTRIIATQHPGARAISRSKANIGQVYIGEEVPWANIATRGSEDWTQ